MANTTYSSGSGPGSGPTVAESAAGTRTGDADTTTTGLLRRLVDDLQTLVRKELALARSEITQSVNDAKQGMASLATGALVLYAGVLTLLASAVLGLSKVVQPWLAALIVGGIVAIVGFVMLQAGRKKLEPSALYPDRTAEALRRDKDMVQRRTP